MPTGCRRPCRSSPVPWLPGCRATAIWTRTSPRSRRICGPSPRTTAAGPPSAWPTSSRRGPRATRPGTRRRSGRCGAPWRWPPDNDQALAGRAALAAARHDFAAALAFADAALRHNPYSERALCSRIDALVELGRYAEAARAARTADARKPGIPVFTRYAYVHELRGDVTTAPPRPRTGPVGGHLAGRHRVRRHPARPARLEPGRPQDGPRSLRAPWPPTTATSRRWRAGPARRRRAVTAPRRSGTWRRWSPAPRCPGPAGRAGRAVRGAGRGRLCDRTRARQQYALVDAWTALARANGVNADLDTALAAADHGDRRAALRAARAEWARRHTVHTADALAWALHVNGRDAEALPYAPPGHRHRLPQRRLPLPPRGDRAGHRPPVGRPRLARRGPGTEPRLLPRRAPPGPRGAGGSRGEAPSAVRPARRARPGAASGRPGERAPLGNFTVNRYDGLVAAPGQLRVDHVEDLAEIPATQAKPGIERLGLGAWARQRCARAAADSGLTVDGRTVTLTAARSSARACARARPAWTPCAWRAG